VFLELLDQPTVLPVITELLGTNTWVNHSHLNANPATDSKDVSEFNNGYGWHIDGGAINEGLPWSSPQRISPSTGSNAKSMNSLPPPSNFVRNGTSTRASSDANFSAVLIAKCDPGLSSMRGVGKLSATSTDYCKLCGSF